METGDQIYLGGEHLGTAQEGETPASLAARMAIDLRLRTGDNWTASGSVLTVTQGSKRQKAAAQAVYGNRAQRRAAQRGRRKRSAVWSTAGERPVSCTAQFVGLDVVIGTSELAKMTNALVVW